MYEHLFGMNDLMRCLLVFKNGNQQWDLNEQIEAHINFEFLIKKTAFSAFISLLNFHSSY